MPPLFRSLDGRALFAAYKVAVGEDYRPGRSADYVPNRPVSPPNAAHDARMRKAEALVSKVAKGGTVRPITLEQAYEKVLTDPANGALARAALRPTSTKGVPQVDEDEDEEDGKSPSSYDDGGNTAHSPRSEAIGRLESDEERAGRPTSATRTFGFGGRKAKIAARVQKFLAMCPGASDDEAMGYALSRKRVRKVLETRLRAS